jgi:LacI family transcriptional regulator
LVVGGEVDAARQAAVDLLARRDRPTALLASNRLLAEGVWLALDDLELRVPADVSVVSFDDARWMSMVTPGVTAVAQDVVGLGVAAVDRLLARLADPDGEPHTVTLDAEILPRGSTAAPRSTPVQDLDADALQRHLRGGGAVLEQPAERASTS